MKMFEFSEPQIQQLRQPWDWRDLQNESPVITRGKISRAEQLGVVAVLYTAEQVEHRIKEIALLEHTIRNGQVNQTVYAGIMKGGVPFAAPLFRNIASLSPNMNPIVDYLQASRYGNSQSGKDALEIIRKLDPRTDISGRHLVMVEDTVDEGVTMELVGRAALDQSECTTLGDGVTGPATGIGIITLTDKEIASLDGYDEENILRGMWVPNVWISGNGLDGSNEAMRWLPEHVIPPVQDEKYREIMPEVLDTLGERAVLGMDDITWISS